MPPLTPPIAKAAKDLIDDLSARVQVAEEDHVKSIVRMKQAREDHDAAAANVRALREALESVQDALAALSGG